MASTLGYITIMYIPVNIILNIVADGQTEFYYLLIGLLITLLVSFILIGLLYASLIETAIGWLECDSANAANFNIS